MTDELHYRAMEMANQRFLAALLQELRNVQKRMIIKERNQ